MRTRVKHPNRVQRDLLAFWDWFYSGNKDSTNRFQYLFIPWFIRNDKTGKINYWAAALSHCNQFRRKYRNLAKQSRSEVEEIYFLELKMRQM